MKRIVAIILLIYSCQAYSQKLEVGVGIEPIWNVITGVPYPNNATLYLEFQPLDLNFTIKSGIQGIHESEVIILPLAIALNPSTKRISFALEVALNPVIYFNREFDKKIRLNKRLAGKFEIKTKSRVLYVVSLGIQLFPDTKELYYKWDGSSEYEYTSFLLPHLSIGAKYSLKNHENSSSSAHY